MKLPKIEFVPLENTTEDAVIDYMNDHPTQSVFLVYLRQRYKHEDKWEYIIDAGCPYMFDDIEWDHDWREGQEFVQYLAITNVEEV